MAKPFGPDSSVQCRVVRQAPFSARFLLMYFLYARAIRIYGFKFWNGTWLRCLRNARRCTRIFCRVWKHCTTDTAFEETRHLLGRKVAHSTIPVLHSALERANAIRSLISI